MDSEFWILLTVDLVLIQKYKQTNKQTKVQVITPESNTDQLQAAQLFESDIKYSIDYMHSILSLRGIHVYLFSLAMINGFKHLYDCLSSLSGNRYQNGLLRKMRLYIQMKLCFVCMYPKIHQLSMLFLLVLLILIGFRTYIYIQESIYMYFAPGKYEYIVNKSPLGHISHLRNSSNHLPKAMIYTITFI